MADGKPTIYLEIFNEDLVYNEHLLLLSTLNPQPLGHCRHSAVSECMSE